MSETRILPVLPLRNLVLFPRVPFPIAAGRRVTLRAIEAALNDGQRRVFAVAQCEGEEHVCPNGLNALGTVVRIQEVKRGLAELQLSLLGEGRAVAVRYRQRDGYLEAAVRDATEVPPADPEDPTYAALESEVRKRSFELGVKSGLASEAIKPVIAGLVEPGHLADFVSAHLDISTKDRQKLLEELSIEKRLHGVLLHLRRQIAIKEAEEDINAKVQKELGSRQREMHLREQLKAIQGELGYADEDLAGLGARLAELDLPPETRKIVDRDVDRLRSLPPESLEAEHLRSYLQTIAELPWSRRSAERIDLEKASRILERDHHGLADVKERVLEFLAVRRLRSAARLSTDLPAAGGSSSHGPILLFLGPPGVGKTSLAESIARAVGRQYVRVSLGGVRDEAAIRGHRRTYVGAMPGRIIQGMKQAGTKNPVFVLDELDKLGASLQGDPASALLEVLDPSQNDSFSDHYLGVPYDLSDVLFIATANLIKNIPPPLLDRMEVVEFSGYTESEKLVIARRYLLPRQIESSGLSREQLRISDEALRRIISSYTREAGVRQLQRALDKLARKAARRLVAGGGPLDAVEPPSLGRLLGRPAVRPERARRDQIGLATGLYYTPAGGDIMPVEASTMPGKGKLILTGQLGEVMQESARAAWTYVRSNAEALLVDAELFDRDVHIHVPVGAVRKDGPSAGVAIASALVSRLTGRPVRHDVAVTGEITLSGRVLPVGGIKEKILGAVRAGVTEIGLPRDNEADLEDLPEDVRSRITVHLLEDLDQALALTLRDACLDDGRLLFTADTGRSPQPLTPPPPSIC